MWPKLEVFVTSSSDCEVSVGGTVTLLGDCVLCPQGKPLLHCLVTVCGVCERSLLHRLVDCVCGLCKRLL
jgi:hypothetical protein